MTSPPLPNCYWVVPGLVLAGEHPGARTRERTQERLRQLLAAGVESFMDLTYPTEVTRYDLDLPFHIEYLRKPLKDHDIPSRPRDMIDILDCLQDAVRSHRPVYVHCRAGIGRTGTVIGCFLVERGFSGDEALDELNRLWQQSERSQAWPHVPETEEQSNYVRRWRPSRHSEGSALPEFTEPVRVTPPHVEASRHDTFRTDAPHVGAGRVDATRAVSPHGGAVHSETAAANTTLPGAGRVETPRADAARTGAARVEPPRGNVAHAGTTRSDIPHARAARAEAVPTDIARAEAAGVETVPADISRSGAGRGDTAPTDIGRVGVTGIETVPTDITRAGVARTGGAHLDTPRTDVTRAEASRSDAAHAKTARVPSPRDFAEPRPAHAASPESPLADRESSDPSTGEADPLLDPTTLEAARQLRERFLGALVGLATGDAVAAATQYRRPGTFTAVGDLLGGGPFDLPRGGWSDDTAMALCLAESLLESDGFNARDQVERYKRWQQEGYLSATDQCVGITASTARALALASWRRQLFAGSHDPAQLDPEPLSRLAPVVLFHFSSLDKAVHLAADSARTTCQAPPVLDSCRLLARALHQALSGQPREAILEGAPTITEEAARSNETATNAFAAALWAFRSTTTFRDAVLKAANLGGHSDVVAAICGGLAGAHYGAAAVPPAWRNSLIRKELIESFADRLLARALLDLSE